MVSYISENKVKDFFKIYTLQRDWRARSYHIKILNALYSESERHSLTYGYAQPDVLLWWQVSCIKFWNQMKQYTFTYFYLGMMNILGYLTITNRVYLKCALFNILTIIIGSFTILRNSKVVFDKNVWRLIHFLSENIWTKGSLYLHMIFFLKPFIESKCWNLTPKYFVPGDYHEGRKKNVFRVSQLLSSTLIELTALIARFSEISTNFQIWILRS